MACPCCACTTTVAAHTQQKTATADIHRLQVQSFLVYRPPHANCSTMQALHNDCLLWLLLDQQSCKLRQCASSDEHGQSKHTGRQSNTNHSGPQCVSTRLQAAASAPWAFLAGEDNDFCCTTLDVQPSHHKDQHSCPRNRPHRHRLPPTHQHNQAAERRGPARSVAPAPSRRVRASSFNQPVNKTLQSRASGSSTRRYGPLQLRHPLLHPLLQQPARFCTMFASEATL